MSGLWFKFPLPRGVRSDYSTGDCPVKSLPREVQSYFTGDWPVKCKATSPGYFTGQRFKFLILIPSPPPIGIIKGHRYP